MNPTTIPITDIRLDSGTQTRVAMDETTIAEYSERMGAGDKFPPVDVFFDGTSYVLADGYHRLCAAKRLGLKNILAQIRKGTVREAIWFAVGANRANGIRRSPDDLRYAIGVALAAFPDRTQQQIASQVGCNQSTVQRVKAELMQTHKLTASVGVKGRDGKVRPAVYQQKDTPSNDPHYYANQLNKCGEEVMRYASSSEAEALAGYLAFSLLKAKARLRQLSQGRQGGAVE